ncbi:GNAT family N-acetyltransferase [Propylenella binzhouense]|uniref:N-acetyltransferase n=1 Tax=Propylenella binzhouense TaxID=2555902 RepID=A0A964WUF0_9HYPH|nr:GNAT family N-acetyltransferase [Propylenella binzhouense]MYZ49057.1 N-acetyltransferase [Propylenella binzhouense]
MAEAEIAREGDRERGRYSLALEGGTAELTFRSAGDGIRVIEHTGVPRSLRGRGIGTRLVARAVEDARREGVRIRPDCPFAAAIFAQRPDYQDLRAQ